MWRKVLLWGAALTWLATFLYFALLNAADLEWVDLFVALLSITAIWVGIEIHREMFTTWRALGLLALAELLFLSWLQWQAVLWGTALRNVNAVCVLFATDTFAGILAVWLLLLIRRDASVWALAIVWVGCPLGLLLSMSQVATQTQLENLPLAQSSVMLAGMCLLGFLAVGGIVAFIAHLMRLLYLELAGKV